MRRGQDWSGIVETLSQQQSSHPASLQHCIDRWSRSRSPSDTDTVDLINVLSPAQHIDMSPHNGWHGDVIRQIENKFSLSSGSQVQQDTTIMYSLKEQEATASQGSPSVSSAETTSNRVTVSASQSQVETLWGLCYFILYQHLS